MTTPARTGAEHAPTVRAGRVGSGAPGDRLFESNYVVECPCGFRANCATLDPSFAQRSAAEHLRDVESGWWKPDGYEPEPDLDIHDDITYVVEYDEIIHRRCQVTITYEDDRQFETTAAAVRFAVLEGDTDEDYEIDSGTHITSWRPE